MNVTTREESNYEKITKCSGAIKDALIVEHNGNSLKPDQYFLNTNSYFATNV